MRINLTNDKEKLSGLISLHLSKILSGKKVDLIINGDKHTGIIQSVDLEEQDGFFQLLFRIDDQEKKIPILDETKATVGKELMVFETKNHTTVIEVID